ncbi:MAG: dihydrodipicolinate synthase family protein [Pirellulaceae bacterium]
MLKPEEMKQRLKGMTVIVMTPFDEHDEVDYEGLKRNVEQLVGTLQGKDAVLVASGSNSEFYALAEEERRRVIQTVVETAGGRLPVVAGTAEAGTRRTIQWSKYAEEVGADGVMVVAPYYHVPSEEGMYAHYARVAESINIGIMIYNNPQVTGSWIKPSLMARLSEIDNIIGDKETTTIVQNQLAMLKGVDPEKMTIVCGAGELMFSYMSLAGSPGFVATPMGNFAPNFFYGFLEASRESDFKKIKDLVSRVELLVSFIGRLTASHGHTGAHASPFTGGHWSIPVTKAGMNLVGMVGGRVRLPLIDLDEAEYEELRSVMVRMGVL